MKWVDLRTGCSALALAATGGLWAPAMAHAQDEVVEIEEIIVTAQRREENIQEVPIAISVLDDRVLSNALEGVADIRSLALRAPGLYAESSNGRVAPRFYIRGLGNVDFDLAASQPVLIIMDEVVQENVALKSFPIFDIDRVEVLRGPQGTLFGRNTPAGAVKFETRKPTQEFEGFADFSYGRYNTINSEAAAGGPIVQDKLAFRLSGLYQRRDNFIDDNFNDADFLLGNDPYANPEEDRMGGFRELAGRFQLLFTPTPNLSILGNVHARDLNADGAAIFRANVVGDPAGGPSGTSGLNSNFDRDLVYQFGAQDRQEYSAVGGNIRIDYDFAGLTLSSITAVETVSGFSGGDVDGGVAVFDPTLPAPPNNEVPVSRAGLFFGAVPATTLPGQINIPSATQDSIDELTQITQEVRLSGQAVDGRLNWQTGFFFFDSEAQITTANQVNPRPGPDGESLAVDIAPAGIVEQTNTSYAGFAHADYRLTEKLKVTGGIRYTYDEKELDNLLGSSFGTPLTPEQLAAADRDADAGEVTGEFAVSYSVTPNVSLYARYARGFRAPSLQGRDIGFNGTTSQADSEFVNNYEAGYKATLFDNRLRANLTFFYLDINDLQLTAVGGEGNSISLINSEGARTTGVEFDVEALPMDGLRLTGSFAYVDSEIQDEGLGVSFCAQCTVNDPIDDRGFALIDGNPLPQAPEVTASFTARYGVPVYRGEAYIFTDWVFQGETSLFLYDSPEFTTRSQIEGGLRVGYLDDRGYELSFFVRNLTDEENIQGAIDFSNNAAFVNEPRIFGVTLGADF